MYDALAFRYVIVYDVPSKLCSKDLLGAATEIQQSCNRAATELQQSKFCRQDLLV